MLKFVVFVILAVLAPSFALISDFNLIQCPGIPLPKDVSLDECPNGNPCNIHVGDTISVYDTVVLNEPVTGLIGLLVLSEPMVKLFSKIFLRMPVQL
uniref:Putative secreted protein n=1 Tax=Lutzomyia longipalpis TaxID=7200 RepID=A0A1B0C9W5_LUTLO